MSKQKERAVPSESQLTWHRMEFYGFIHFGLNTFTDKEWGYGDESPALFNPTDFNADQIVKTAKEGGMSGLILTCKHHDGFCLWPSKYTEHSVKNSPWKEGRGDLVKDISEACARFGLKFGVYLSPWDRNHAEYGRESYIQYYRNQLEELTTQYGALFEVWFDGANGGDGYYGGAREIRQIDRKTYYDWEQTWDIVRQNQPGAVIFSDAGPDIRWVGNENGIAGDPCWHCFNRESLFPGFGGDQTVLESDMVKAWGSDREMLETGDPNGTYWVPAECDVSIRPGWFYHKSEDAKVRSAENLMELYFQSVGRGSNFLLNLPPDKRGRIYETDGDILRKFKRQKEELFKVDLVNNMKAATVEKKSEKGDTLLEMTYTWSQNVSIHIIQLMEAIEKGQLIRHYLIEGLEGSRWKVLAEGSSIGNNRLIRFKKRDVNKVRIKLSGKAGLFLKTISIY